MKLASTLAAMMLATSAPAATFDFADYAATHGEGSWREITGGSLTEDGITVRAFGGGRAGSVAFLDAPTARGPAGLGACSSWSCTSGVPGANVADDNISRTKTGVPETLRLMFSEPVKITDLFLRGANHPPATGRIRINGSLYAIAAGIVADPLGSLGIASGTWDFTYAGTEEYIPRIGVAPVPLPAAAWMLIAAIGGIGALKLRRARG